MTRRSGEDGERRGDGSGSGPAAPGPPTGEPEGTLLDVGGRRGAFGLTAVLTYLTKLSSSALSLVSVLIVARVLGPEGRGDVAFAIAVAKLTSNVATFGFQEANSNLAGTFPHLRPAIATNSVLVALVLGALAAGAVGALVLAVPAAGGDLALTLLWLTLGTLPVLIMKPYFTQLVQADYGFAVTNAAWVFGPALNVVVNGGLALAGELTVTTAIVTWLGGQALTAAWLMWYVSRRLAGFGRPDLGLARRMLGFGLKAHLGRMIAVGNYRLDQWLIGIFAGSRELGLYSVAVAWAEALWNLPAALVAVQRPDLVRASRREAVRRATLVLRTATIVTVPLALGMIVLAPFLCVTVFGAEFRGAIDDLRVLVPGALLVLALKLLGNALVAQGKPMLQTAAVSVAFVCTVVLDLVLIPRYGGLGAAIASTAAYTIGSVAVVVIFIRALGGRPADFVPKASDVPLLVEHARGSLRRVLAVARH